MKSIINSICITIFSAFLCSFENVSDEEMIQMGMTQEMLDYLKADSIEGQSGNIDLHECHATLSVPDGFYYIDAEQTKKLLVEYWGNPDNRASNMLGAMLPSSASCFYEVAAAFIITHEKSGYVKDDDASNIDYDDLLKEMQHATEEENKKLPARQQFTLKGWAVTPHYIQDKHVLIWAKHLVMNDGETINYDMRILGKDGFVSINAVVDPEYLDEAKGYGDTMIGSIRFYDGYAYSDFDPKKDHVSEWTIGGLVAGGILAKSGLLAKIGVLLLKSWKLVALAFLAIVATVTKIFKRKSDKPVVADPAEVCKKFE